MNTDKLERWVQAGRRTVSIEFGEPGDNRARKIWVYDYELMEGVHISHPDEIESIDLLSQKRERLKKEMERFERMVEKEG